jgi:hypothetical protein
MQKLRDIVGNMSEAETEYRQKGTFFSVALWGLASGHENI